MSTKTVARVDYTEGKLLKKMLFFAIPMILSTLLQLLFNAADVAVVGRFAGTVYQSAVGATTSTIHLIVNLLMGVSVGANVAMATAYGAKDDERQHRIVHTSILLALVGGILIMLIGVLAARPILTALKTPSDALEYAILYMQIYFLGAPASIVYNFGAALYRAVGETKKPLMYLFVSGIVNIVINIVAVVFFHMHVVGVALGTIISQYVACALVIFDLVKEQSAVKLVLKKLRFYRRELVKVLMLGIPTGISSSMFSISNVLIQSTVNSYGSIVVAGKTVAGNIDSFIDVFSSSFGNTTLTVIGQNVGARKPKRIRRALGAGCLLCAVSTAMCSLLMLCFGRYVYAIFNSDPLVIEEALVIMRNTTVSYPLVVGLSIFGAALRGVGYSLTPMFVNLIEICLARVVWIYWIYPLAPSPAMIYLSYPVTWVLSGVSMVVLYFYFEKKFLRKFESENTRKENSKSEEKETAV